MKKNLTIILSGIHKAISFEWTAELLPKDKFNISFILMNPGDSEMEHYLMRNHITFKRITYHGKKDLLKAFIEIFFFLAKNKADFVHTHLFDANIAGLTAAYFCRVPKRVYSRHHAMDHHRFFPGAVKYDRFINRIATNIIAVSENVRHILADYDKADPCKIYVIPHGFRFGDFDLLSEKRVAALKSKYETQGKFPVIGIISRYTIWKGVQYIIPAFKKLLSQYPDALLVLANAGGNYQAEIRKLLLEIPEKNFIEIPFEEDFIALYKLFDIFIHAPVDKECEAFGQTYVEALASGIPSVFTLSGIASDFIRHRHNAWVVDYKNSDQIYAGIVSLLTDKSLCDKIATNGKQEVHKLFAIEKMIRGFEKVYLSE